MATGQPQKFLSRLKKSRKFRDALRKNSRKLSLEHLEDRRVMATAVTGPTLVALATNAGDKLLSDVGAPLNNVAVHTSPRELDFLFAQGQKIDSSTLATGLKLVAAGVDAQIGTPDDVVITPGYVGLLDDPRSVVMRFAATLPDDLYQVTVVGSGVSPLKDQQGLPFNGGTDEKILFTLNAGAQVQAIVPQPVSRDAATLQLSQSGNTVDVYFNNDKLNAITDLTSPGNVKNPAFYQLINMSTLNIEHPTGITYTFDAASGLNKATLTFASTIAKGTYKLQIGTVVAPSNTLVMAVHEGGPVTAVHAYIGDNPSLTIAQLGTDVDLYRFDVAVAGNFSATLTSFGSLDGAIRIFNSAGAPVGGPMDVTGAGGINGAVEIRAISALAAGTYYVGISSKGNTTYNAVNGSGTAGPGTTGAYTLSVSFATPTPISDQTSFAESTTNANVGTIGEAGLNISGSISTRPYNLIWPGAGDLPGHRDIPDETHLDVGPEIATASVPVIIYNFQDHYGDDPQTGTPFHNAITENQKARTREIMQLYSRYMGVEFVEAPDPAVVPGAPAADLIVATGDLRALNPTIPTGGTVLGLGGPGEALMNAGHNWGNSEYGGEWFQTAMHEIGHALGLGHSYDLPSLTIQGGGETPGATGGEPVFPGDNDIIHGQTLYRPASRDIDLYKFTLAEAGQWSAEAIAQRVRASVSTDFNTGGLVSMRFDAVADGFAGNGIQVVFTKSDRGIGTNPGINVNLVTRVVSIDLNSNAVSGTTAQQLIAALSANVAASQLIQAQVVSGNPSVQIATAAIPINYSPLTLTANSSLLDTVLTVYQENVDASTGAVTRNLIARNDDYYGKDSFVDLHLAAGTYYVAVTSKGNTDFDPTVSDTGLGGTTEGSFELKLNFKADGNSVSIKDVSGTNIDGDGDGKPGGRNDFFFQAGPTIFVDKVDPVAPATRSGPLGSITNPYKLIKDALAAAPSALAAQGANGVELIRILGNGGTDKSIATTGDNVPYLIGYNNNNAPLADGQDFLVPKGVTVMVDAGAILKFRKANIDVGSSAQGIDRSHAAIQVLATPQITPATPPTNPTGLQIPTGPAYFTSFANDTLGGDSNGTPAPVSGDWGGIVMRADSDYDHQVNPVYLNYVNHADMTYGGGKVVVNSVESIYDPLHMISSRPNLTFNTITKSADAAISADPNSFDDSLGRLGPNIHANTLVDDSVNGLLVRIRTQFGNPVDVLTLNGRFHLTDITYVIPEDLYINGSPGGPFTSDGNILVARPSARLRIDPGVVVKLSSSRIEARIGSQLIAEGTSTDPIIFTALTDTRFGAGGTYHTQNTSTQAPGPVPSGLWSGLFFGPDSKGSLDFAQVYYAGGLSPIEGGFAAFSPIESYQGDVRIANSLFQYNQNGQGIQGPDGVRNGRGSNVTTGGATIFVRGAQPIIVNNVIRDNAGQVLSINANAMRADIQPDYGRTTGPIANFPQFGDNQGPLVRLNRLTNNSTNGMEIRPATLTTATAWDDTDIVHVLHDEIVVPDFHGAGGLTLKSAPNESLVVKSFGPNAGLTASGKMLDINDRIGGSLYVLGQPGHPVVLTALNDGSVGAGFDPDGLPMNNTNNAGPGGAPPTGTSGAVVIDGGDRDDHGFATNGPDNTPGTPDDVNNDGWQFIQQMIAFDVAGARNNAPNDVLVLGATSGQALDAITSVTTVLGLNMTVVTGNQISTVNFRNYKVIYVPSNDTNTSGGITQPELDLLALRRTEIQQFVNTGGSLVALTEAESPTPYAWLALPLPFTITDFTAGGIIFPLRKTQAAINAGFTITNQELTLGTPYHNDFTGPPGFNGLVPFVLDTGDDNVPDNADDRVITLGLGSGSFGIGITGGTWRGIKLDQNSNDRNVTTVNETENVYAGPTNLHGDPQHAQFIGNLAPDLKSGDDNRKLGFEVHGNVSLNNPQNVDVYSFTADSGTEVWVNLDHTSSSLQGIVELVDANGNTIARSVPRSTDHNATVVNKLTGLAADMTKDVQDTSADPQHYLDYAGRNYFSLNPVDPGFRVVLPGDNLKQATYFIRVRSQGAANGSQDDDITKGLTSGRYQLNVRLRQMDEIAGSQIRYSDIKYATTGIDVQGLPLHSYLAGESTNAGNGNNTFAGAQDLGNLLTADRNAISVSGNLANQADVQWFSFALDYDLIQAIGGVNNADRTWSTIFDFDYADGLSRPDATISVFDAAGRLLFVSRDSQVQADQPQPGHGVNFDDMSRGSDGVLDPFIGSAQLPAGTPAGQPHRYFVAVSSNRGLPTAMDGTFRATATSPALRLEPVDSMRRIMEDHIGSQGGSTAAPPETAAFSDITTVAGLQQNVTPYNLSDVQLYIHTGGTLNIVDPYAPPSAARPALAPVGSGGNIDDIVFRSDGVLYGVQDLPGVANTAGQLVTIDPATGAVTVIGKDNIPDFDPNANPPDPQQDTANSITAMAMEGSMFAVTQGVPLDSAISLYYAVPDQFSNVSRLYRADPISGTAAVTNGKPWGRVGAFNNGLITSAGFATATTDFGTTTFPRSLVTFTSVLPGTAGNGTSINFTTINDPNQPNAIVTGAGGNTVNVSINAATTRATASTDFNTNNAVTVTFDAKANGAAGNGIQIFFSKQNLGAGAPPTIFVNGQTINVTLNSNASTPTKADELVTFFSANVQATALLTASVTAGNGKQDIATPPITYSPVILAGGRNPASAQDVANAINNSALAATLVTAQASGNRTGDITGAPNSVYSPVILSGGTAVAIGQTTGMAFANDGTLWGVSDSGTFYQISTATARASNLVTIPGTPRFTGLTLGPQNLYGGAYKDLFFASASNGLVYALNKAGQVQQVFGAADQLDPNPTATSVATGVFGSVGLAFSPLDFNLFHPTNTRRLDAGHGLNAAPDNSRVVTVQGGTSFAFNLEEWTPNGGTTYTLPAGGAGDAQYGILTTGYHQDLTSNPNIGNNYNLPGGAHGNLITDSFSLQGYSPSIKPTLYFNYLEDSPHNVWVSISTDNGATWQPVAGNGDPTTRQQFVGRYLSSITPSLNDPKPAFISASITDAPANPLQRLQHLWDDPNWRQARVDLSEYAGIPNLRLQFNVSTFSAGFYNERGLTNLQHEGFYLDDILVGFAGRGEMITAASPDVTGFFQTPTPVRELGRPLPPTEVLNGPYQLEIRRGTEYGATLSPLFPTVTLFDTYDPRDNFVQDDRDVLSDGFETGNFSALPWVNNSPSPWRITNSANKTGSFSAQAGVASSVPSQNSDLTLTAKTGTGEISFARKVSSNAGSGTLRFYIDGVLQGEWSGDIPMGTVSFPLTATVGSATHTFRWSYQKDSADNPTTGILDTAWIDDVRLQAPNVDFELSNALPAIFHTSLTPDQLDHSYAGPGTTTPFDRPDNGERPWFVTNTDSNTGTQSARSAVLSPNMTSELSTVKLTGEGTLRFAYKVVGNGTLRLFIDGGLAKLTSAATAGWQTSNSINLTAGYHNFLWVYTTGGSVAATDAAFLDDIVFPTANIGTGTIGDQNQYREQGSIVIEENKITSASQIGIAVHPGPRGAGGSLPYPSSVINGPTLNNARLTDGVTIVNNVVANYGQTGILFAGDPNNGQPAAAVPFGRIFNNTIYGGSTKTGVAIQVQNNAGPTLLNNIVANAVTGISIDASSAPNTVVGNNLYSNDTTNLVFPGGVQTNPIVINETPGVTDPLFVNPIRENFYLAPGSQAIDNSVDKLDDRFNYVAVKRPLAIGESPIIAPTTDLYGQLRQDDPNGGPTGGGQNIFKDIGAIDRVDFELPTAGLTTPLDNDPAGKDLDPTADTVLLNNVALNKIEIQLSDIGIGIDDATVLTAQFVITADGVKLIDGVDYTFIYNANKHLVTFLPSSGVFPFNVKYVITVDNSSASGILDLAGNPLRPNHITGPYAGKTVFEIFDGILYSFGTAPAPYPTLLVDDGARHIIVPGMFLGTGVQATPDGVPTANPNGDGDGGISNFSLVAGSASHFDVTASLAGKLDVWIDTNKDGDWNDAGEHVLAGQSIAAGTSTVNFALPPMASGSAMARFRYSSAGVSLPTGQADDGEVDDYKVVVNGPAFQNPNNPLDVTADGFVSPIDALRIINFINRYRNDPYFVNPPNNGNMPVPNPFALTAPDYLDVNGDGFVAFSDAIQVINFINANSQPPNGEGEGVSSLAASAPALTSGPVSTADAVSAPSTSGQGSIPPVLFANSSVVLEVKSPTASQTKVDDQVFGDGNYLVDDAIHQVVDELHVPSQSTAKSVTVLSSQEDEDDAWEGLLTDLAKDGLTSGVKS